MGPVSAHKTRRGSYTVLGAMVVPVLLGFGALAVDMAWLRMAALQAQDLSDAASQAALMTLRRTGDTTDATSAAEAVVARNTIAGGDAELVELQFGTWDEAARVFTVEDDGPNAVRARVGRRDADGVPYLLARIWGFDKADVIGASTSAARSLHVVLVIDITNSWDLRNFDYAREASTTFLDILTDAYGPMDKFGMVHFTSRYGVEYSPMKLVSSEAFDGAAMTKWQAMNTASKSGRPNPAPLDKRCVQHVGSNTWAAGTHGGDAASHGAGGCFPGMWREYSDERGTDHSVGLDMARLMFEEQVDDSAYRAVIVLTDGAPNGIDPTNGAIRASQAYVDPTRHVIGPAPRTITDITTDSVTTAHLMYADLKVNTWVVSFVATGAFMEDMTSEGDGYFERATSAAAIVPIFEDIANSLPLAIVE